MVYGLISDIHGSLEALEAVLAELKDCDTFICLGDIVGYGPDPAACLERVRDLPGLVCIAGNHDLAVVRRFNVTWFNEYAREAVFWTQRQLSAEHISYLDSLPLRARAGEAELVHGSLPEEMDYITTTWEAASCFEAMTGNLCFIGHTHVAEYYWQEGNSGVAEQKALWSGGAVPRVDGRRYIVNPGGVGQPRDGNSAASCGRYDTESGAIEVRRVPYDVARVQAKMREAKLPESLAKRLAVGR